MFAEQMANAINDARTLTRLDDLSRAIWQGWGANAVTDDQAQELASLIHARKQVMRGEVKPVGIPRGVHPSSRRGASAGSCAVCGHRPEASPGSLRTASAVPGLQVHGRRTRSPPDRDR